MPLPVSNILLSSLITYGSLIFGQIRLRSRMSLMSIRHFHIAKLACALASQGTSERRVFT